MNDMCTDCDRDFLCFKHCGQTTRLMAANCFTVRKKHLPGRAREFKSSRARPQDLCAPGTWARVNIEPCQCVVRVVDLPGAQNRLPDLLSMWSLNPGALSEFRRLTGHMDMRKKQIPDAFFFFSHLWWKVRPALSTGHVSRAFLYACVHCLFGSWPNWSS